MFVNRLFGDTASSEEYFPEITGGGDVFTLGTEFLVSQSLQPALFTVNMPALDGHHRIVVVILKQ